MLSRDTYLHECIEDRDMTLQGVNGFIEESKSETIYGPIFYMTRMQTQITRDQRGINLI